MASRVAVQGENLRGVGKERHGVQNRQALRDIGNVAPALVADGKPLRPQKPADKKVVEAVRKINKVKVQQKAVEVIDISSDDEEVNSSYSTSSTTTIEEMYSTEARSMSVSSNRKGGRRTFTSTLSARSKVACGIAYKPNDVVVDIDAQDMNNELAVVEYVEDMHKYYKETEDDGRVQDYMNWQPNINTKMRTILVDWLIDVHRKFELMPESLYLTVNILDRYLSKKVIPRSELQLVGMGAMLIACKYEEIWAPEVNDFVGIANYAYVNEQLLTMEKRILGKLEWYLTVPTPYVFLVRYIKASVPYDSEVENLVFFYAELGLGNYATILCSPSMLSASAVYAARSTLNKAPIWTQTLKYQTGYSEDEIIDCAKLLGRLQSHCGSAESKQKATYRKYSNPDKGAVALLPHAKCLVSVEEE